MVSRELNPASYSSRLTCNVCNRWLGSPFFSVRGGASVFSDGTLCQYPRDLYFCDRCGHCRSNVLPNLDSFYADEYKFLVQSEAEDQLYCAKDGQLVFRQEHQLTTLLNKLRIPRGAQVLDFGCGKGIFLKMLAMRRPDIIPHFFDVSDVYVPFWEKLASLEQWAVGKLNPLWAERFDIVLSLFSLEHVAQPLEILQSIHGLLKPNGTIYCIVPNSYGIYIADFLVAEHVNLFSEASLGYLFGQCGFEITQIDATSHDVAFIIMARKGAPEARLAESRAIASVRQKAEDIGLFWTQATGRVQMFEREHWGRKSAIYGAGIVGAFIFSCLQETSVLQCFIDQNPHKQQRKLMGKPIVSPSQLGSDIQLVYVGLNPAMSVAALQSIREWKHRNVEYFHL